MLAHIISTTTNRTDRNWWYSDFVLCLPNFGLLLAFGPENFHVRTNCHGLFFFLQSVVTPIAFLFWTIFSESPFGFDPNVHVTTWFSIGALIFMVPAIFVYNTGWVTVRPLFIVTFQNHVWKFLTNVRIFVLIVQTLGPVLCSKFASSKAKFETRNVFAANVFQFLISDFVWWSLALSTEWIRFLLAMIIPQQVDSTVLLRQTYELANLLHKTRPKVRRIKT